MLFLLIKLKRTSTVWICWVSLQ